MASGGLRALAICQFAVGAGRGRPGPGLREIGEGLCRLGDVFTGCKGRRVLGVGEMYWGVEGKKESKAGGSRKRAILEQTNWVVGWYQDFVYDEVGSTVLVEKSPEMLEKHKEWEAYAKNLVQTLPGAEDEAAVAQAEKALADAIRSDLEEWAEKAGKGLDEYQIKAAVDYFVKEVSGAVGGPAGTAAPPTPDP